MNTPAKILVAEDEPITRGLFKVVLETAGYEVILVEDGAAAIEKAASEHPDLVMIKPVSPADLIKCVEKYLGAAATPTGMASKSIDQDTPRSKEESEGTVLDGSELRDALTSLQTP